MKEALFKLTNAAKNRRAFLIVAEPNHARADSHLTARTNLEEMACAGRYSASRGPPYRIGYR
jgi:hypothetical protein